MCYINEESFSQIIYCIKAKILIYIYILLNVILECYITLFILKKKDWIKNNNSEI